MRRLFFCLALIATGAPLPAQQLTLPRQPGSIQFAVIGDMGTGRTPQYELAARMETVRHTFPFDFVITLGDNIYGGSGANDFLTKFELPYKALLDAGVKFYASLGNHDGTEQSLYKPFNMGGRRYYTYNKGKTQFFALDSNYLSPDELSWLQKELRNSTADWKISYFHHPLYSSSLAHGSDLGLRKVLEPLFLEYGVQVVFSGHDHVYERMKPQKGVSYFVEGAAGQLRKGNLKSGTSLTAIGYDQDLSFILIDISGNTLSFHTVSRTGRIVDSGLVTRAGPID
jgi:3',5'-cyclic AMP phosphodiesterase CpdA